MKCALPVFLLCLALAACNGPDYWPREKFSAQAWQQSAPGERYRFAKDLQQSGTLEGKTRGEVVAILGKPDFEHPDGSYVSYLLRTGGLGFDQVFAIDVRFEAGRVSAIRVGGD